MASLTVIAKRVAPRALGTTVQQIRGMATEKQIFNQIVSTKNIRKITSSMKMVSAAKLKGDENRLSVAKAFNGWTGSFCDEHVEIPDEGATFEDLPQKTLIVPFTSERGLCGGVNSFVSRTVRDAVKKIHAQGKECDIVVVGDKGRSQMRRTMSTLIKRSATDIVSPGTFALASGIASEVLAAGAADEYDAVLVVYNKFVNAATYKQAYKIIKPMKVETLEGEDVLATYEFEPDEKAEGVADLYEYLLASQIFHAFMDSACSEQSSRMTAMENASKNAGEMIDSLTLKYNRARQARITTELIEIISGASAIDK
jgi:F-type H+-transporting ATPase subunit gamma